MDEALRINKSLGTFETLRITKANESFYVGAAVIANSLGVYFIRRVDFINKEIQLSSISFNPNDSIVSLLFY